MTGYRRFGVRLRAIRRRCCPGSTWRPARSARGCPTGSGVALAGKYLDELPYRVWVLCGDSEMAEGSIWEALDKASYYELSNLIGDRRRQPARPARPDRARLGPRRLRPPGRGVRLPGAAHRRPRPRRDRRGAGRRRRRHGRQADGDPRPHRSRAAASPRSRTTRAGTASRCPPTWPSGPSPSSAANATCWYAARGPRPARAGAPDGTADGARDPADVHDRGERSRPARPTGRRSTALGAAARRRRARRRGQQLHPRRRVRQGVPRALLRDVHRRAAAGRRRRRASASAATCPFASTFAAFLTRAYDFIRMAAISQADIRLVGSHAGVEIGADGPSQMALEDLAMMRAVHGSTVLYPATRPARPHWSRRWPTPAGSSTCGPPAAPTPSSTTPTSRSPSAAPRSLRSAAADAVTLVGAGVTLHECLAAADQLAARRDHARVIDLYSVKPIDARHADRRRGRDRRPHRRRRGPPSRGRPRLRRSRSAARRGSPSAALRTSEVSGTAWLGHEHRVAERRRHRRCAHRGCRRHLGRGTMRNAWPDNRRVAHEASRHRHRFGGSGSCRGLPARPPA